MIRSWPSWVFLVVTIVVMGLPRVPHYQEGLPYLQDLGGPALVSWYIGLGFFSLGVFGVTTGLTERGASFQRRVRSWSLGVGSLILSCSFGALYFFAITRSAGM